MSKPLIEETWRKLVEVLGGLDASDALVTNMRQAFVGGLYAASAAISAERADSRVISESAHRIEQSAYPPEFRR